MSLRRLCRRYELPRWAAKVAKRSDRPLGEALAIIDCHHGELPREQVEAMVATAGACDDRERARAMTWTVRVGDRSNA